MSVWDFFLNKLNQNQQSEPTDVSRPRLSPYRQRPIPPQLRSVGTLLAEAEQNGADSLNASNDRVPLNQPPVKVDTFNRTPFRLGGDEIQTLGENPATATNPQDIRLNQPLTLENADKALLYGNPSDDRINLTDSPQVGYVPAVSIQPETPLTDLQQSEQKLGQLQDYQNNPVVNNDKGFGGRLWDIVKQAIYAGGQQVAANGGRFNAGTIGALGVGALEGGFNPKVDEIRKRQFDINQERIRLGGLQQQQDFNSQQALKNAQIGIANQKPAIEQQKVNIAQQKAETESIYKTETIALGKRKADELKIYRDAITDLKERGADQYDVRLKQLQDTIEEAKRRNKEAEKDKDLDREARIKVAQILLQSRVDVANINQTGANDRNQANIQANKEKLTALIEQRNQALANKNQVDADRIDAQIKAAKVKAKAALMSDEDIKAIFGDN